MDDWHERYNKACDEMKAAEIVFKEAERHYQNALDRKMKADKELTHLFHQRARQVNG